MILLFLGVGVAVAATQSALLFGLRVGVGDQYIWSQGAADLASGRARLSLKAIFIFTLAPPCSTPPQNSCASG